MFHDLNRICVKKKYYFKNGEEELYFSNGQIHIEIYHHDEIIDLIIGDGVNRMNYQHSPLLTANQKGQIYSAINSIDALECKCKTIDNVLLNLFIK